MAEAKDISVKIEPIEESAAIIKCPQCKQTFTLNWESWDTIPTTLIIRSCPSGGIYDVSISCPHCDFEEAL